MSWDCPRCGTTLVESEDDVTNYELEGSQVRHTIKRCAELEKERAHMMTTLGDLGGRLVKSSG